MAVSTLTLGGLPALVAGCGPGAAVAPTWVRLDIDPASLPLDEPREITFEVTTSAGTHRGSTWVVRRGESEVTAFSPLCTHRPCAYAWSSERGQFLCTCHDGVFDLEGAVLAGPPPRPLDRFPARVTSGRLEVEVPAPVQS
jgi:Rieske Fe-S protein